MEWNIEVLHGLACSRTPATQSSPTSCAALSLQMKYRTVTKDCIGFASNRLLFTIPFSTNIYLTREV